MTSNNTTVTSEDSPLLSATAVSSDEGFSSVAVEQGNITDDALDVSTTFKQDILDTFHLAVPIFISRVSYVGVSSYTMMFGESLLSSHGIFLSLDENN